MYSSQGLKAKIIIIQFIIQAIYKTNNNEQLSAESTNWALDKHTSDA